MLVLASASPRRSELLRAAGLDFTVAVSGVEEPDRPGEGAEEAAARHALAKARAVSATLGPDVAVVLGADTVVAAADGTLLGKPTDVVEAESHLRTLSGTTHDVVTAVCLLDHPGGDLEEFTVRTRVTMRALTDEEVRRYVDSGEGIGKAGGYAIQETADSFVTSLDGSRSNVVGLPVDEVVQRLQARGIPA
ncbi:MAG: Maf family protein [Planctomycetota bacterium]